MNPGEKVILQGTVLSERSGFVRVRWENGSVTYEWAPDVSAAPKTLEQPGALGSMTDEEFKEKIVKSYNRCAAEHKAYKWALDWIASQASGQLSFATAQLVARQTLRESAAPDSPQPDAASGQATDR